jgi:hypothetical protein
MLRLIAVATRLVVVTCHIAIELKANSQQGLWHGSD